MMLYYILDLKINICNKYNKGINTYIFFNTSKLKDDKQQRTENPTMLNAMMGSYYFTHK